MRIGRQEIINFLLILLILGGIGIAADQYTYTMLPRVTATYDLGNSTKVYDDLSINRVKFPNMYLINATNTTLTSSNVTQNFITNMSGNHTITLPTAASCGNGTTFEFWEACNKIGGTGNFTVNVTSAGNVNGVDIVTVTNTAAAAGNVSAFFARTDGTAWYLGILKR